MPGRALQRWEKHTSNMAKKKQTVQIHRDLDMAEIDQELDVAIDQLEEANERIGGLLASFGPPPEQEPGNGECALPETPPEEASGELSKETVG